MCVFLSSEDAIEIINCGVPGRTKEPNETSSEVIHSTGSCGGIHFPTNDGNIVDVLLLNFGINSMVYCVSVDIQTTITGLH